jgi:hypothetical protein
LTSRAAETGASGLERACRAAAALALALAFLVAAVVSARLARLAWRGEPRTRAALVARLRALPDAGGYRQALARQDLARGRPERARRRLRAALRHAPLASGLWHDLADALLRAGRAAEAADAAERAARLAPTDAGGCYRAALVQLQAGDGARARGGLRCVLEYAPARAPEVFELARAVYGDDEVIVRAILPPGAEPLRRFVAWAYQQRLEDAAAVGWEALQAAGGTSSDRLRHVDFLLRLGRVRAAEELWTAAYGPRGPGIVFDGDFEGDPVGAGFGWHLGSPKGARATVTGGRAAARGVRGLAIEFTGGNLDFRHVWQVVPVTGGRRYHLSAVAQAAAITSLSGPRLRVEAGASCPSFSVEAAEWRGTTPWTPVSLEFTTPPGCEAIIIAVRRPETRRLDRDLRGRLYLDDVKLSDLGASA